MKENVLILYSGGSDSRLMLEIAINGGYEPYCLLINYEQLHHEELKFASEQLTKKGINFHEVSINNLKVNSGLTGDGIKNDTEVVHSMHVPGRNSIFLSLAFSVAESKNIDTIWIGCDLDDSINLFPDCTQEYLLKMNEAFKFAGPKPIKIEAPILGISKNTVNDILRNMDIKIDEVFSGYGNL